MSFVLIGEKDAPTVHLRFSETNENITMNNDLNNTTLIRRSERVKTQQKHLNDFSTRQRPSIDHTRPEASHDSSPVHPLSNFVSYVKFSKSHKFYLASITEHDEPRNYYQAVKDAWWQEVLQNEINPLEQNSTWTLENFPPRKRLVISKWVYKIKF